MIIEAGVSPGRWNDWPNGWGGGLSTWDICLSGVYSSIYLTRSDRRYKREIRELREGDLRERFMRLRPVEYYLRKDLRLADDPDRLRFGFIASEVEELFPNLVIHAGLPDTIARGLEYDGFIPILVKVVQEQERRLAVLEQENARLRARLAELEAR